MSLSFDKQGPVASIGLNRPQAKNALDPDTLRLLFDAWQEVNRDDSIRVAILYSCLPEIFCAGMDLKAAIPVLTKMRPPENENEKWLIQWGAQVGEAMLKPNRVLKPVIAAINGYCLTGGFEMVMGADIRIASEDARFQMREARLGIMPTGGSNVYLPRMLGSCRAMEILLTADVFSAQTLYEWGFLNRVAPRENLMAEAMVVAEKIAANGPLAVQGIIRMAREGRDLTYEQAFVREMEIGVPIFAGADAREGVTAQQEKRLANFPGKY